MNFTDGHLDIIFIIIIYMYVHVGLSCLDSSAGRALCLECRVLNVESHPRQLILLWKTALDVLCCFALLFVIGPCLLLSSFLLISR